jgi:Domain of unknown function (DUF4062)
MSNSPHLSIFHTCHVIGFLTPVWQLPTFTVPLVSPIGGRGKWPNSVYVQRVGPSGLVENFDVLDAPIELQARLDPPYLEVSIGDRPSHVAISKSGEPVVGSRESIAPTVRSWLPEIVRRPLTSLAMADFCADEEAIVNAARDAFEAKVAERGSEGATSWFSDMIVFRRIERTILRKAATLGVTSKIERALDDVLLVIRDDTLEILAPSLLNTVVPFTHQDDNFKDALVVLQAVGVHKIDYQSAKKDNSQPNSIHSPQGLESGERATIRGFRGRQPRYSVMLSSTYAELTEHRLAVRDAMLGQQMFPVAMENDAALPDQDLISASLVKVDESDAYVGLISYRYGQMPESPDRNPTQLSLTELEFRRAVDRDIPICMFIMHDDHPVPRRAVHEERGTEQKLDSFISLAKKDRIYAEFKSADDLKAKAVQSLIKLREVLDRRTAVALPSVESALTRPAPVDLTQGWEIVDRAAIAEIRAHPPSTDVMVQFFDGILPTWRLALAPGVQPRAIAERLANRLRAVHTGATKPEVVLLAGAGGEGKSTAVLHVAAALVDDERQAWTCLHRQAANAGLPEGLFSQLPVIPGHAWVVVIDDADNIGPAILAAVKKIASRTDVHLLLAARDAEWQLKRLAPGMWQPVANFHTEPLVGLDEADARHIVSGWLAWGDEAMGKLKGRSEADAITALLGHARDLATRKEDGELLGALLVTRQGEDMRDHVRTLVNGLGRNVAVKTFTLRDIYAMVAAMHAENQLYLSCSVLAFALGCDVDELERKALLPLRREAMLDSGDTYILTRHRRIAEAALAVMREDNDDVDRWYPLLARAALRAFRKDAFFVSDLRDWNFGLARHFVDKGERSWSVARNVANAVCEAQPGHVQSLTALTFVLRRTGRAMEAMTMLRAKGETFRNDRSILYEWSTVAGTVGDHGLDAWLCGRTLADGGEPINSVQCKLSLAGLGAAFRELFTASQIRAFATGEGACGQLGLRLEELDATARGYFKRYVAEGRRNGIADLSSEQAVEAVRKGVIAGANDVEPGNDPVFFEELLGDPEGYRYTALLRFVGASAKRAAKPTRTKQA